MPRNPSAVNSPAALKLRSMRSAGAGLEVAAGADSAAAMGGAASSAVAASALVGGGGASEVATGLPSGILAPTTRPAPAPDVADTELLHAVLDGEQDAFADLVARYHKRAFWLAFDVLGRAEDARDVVQEAFLRLHRSLESYDFARNFYTWFRQIVMNLAIDALRKRKTSRSVTLESVAERETDDEGPAAPAERHELRGQVWDVLERLDAKFKAVLVLRDIHGLSCREIAPILAVTHATARWRLHRGRQLFREAWERLEREAVRRRPGEGVLGE